MAERDPIWKRLGFPSAEAFRDAQEASQAMLDVEYRMGVNERLPEGFKIGEGPGGVLAAMGLYGAGDMDPASIRHFNRPVEEGNRVLGSYIDPRATPEQIAFQYQKVRDLFSGSEFPDPDDVLVDASLQYKNLEGYSYEDTLLHELRHRGLRSKRVKDILDKMVEEGGFTNNLNLGRLSVVRQKEHPMYDLIRRQLGGDELSENEARDLKILFDAETSLLADMSEEERMRLGFLPEDIQKRQDGGPMDKDNLDMAVEAYEDLPMLAQMGMGMTPAGVAADAASVGKYARDLERALSAGDRKAARDAALSMGMSGMGFVPGVGDMAAAMMRRGRGSMARGPGAPEVDQDAMIGRFLNIRGQLREEGDSMEPQTRQRLREQLKVLGDKLTDMGMNPRELKDGGSVSSPMGIGQLVYDRYINPVQGFKRGGGAIGGRNFGVKRQFVEEADPANPYAQAIAARDAKGAANPNRNTLPDKGAQTTAATGQGAFSGNAGANIDYSPLFSEVLAQTEQPPEDIVSRGTAGGPSTAPASSGSGLARMITEPFADDVANTAPASSGSGLARMITEPFTDDVANRGAFSAQEYTQEPTQLPMEMNVQPDGSVMPGADQPVVTNQQATQQAPQQTGMGGYGGAGSLGIDVSQYLPDDLSTVISQLPQAQQDYLASVTAGEQLAQSEPGMDMNVQPDGSVLPGADQPVVTAGEQLAQGSGGQFGLEEVQPGQNLGGFSYDDFDPNEVSYVKALFTAMGYDPEQNETAVQEILQNQFGTGDQVSKDTLLMTFGRTDDGPGLLTAMGTVGTYGEYLDSLNQQAAGDGTVSQSGSPVVDGTELEVQPGGEIMIGSDQGGVEPAPTDQTAGEQLAESSGGQFGLEEVQPGQNLQDFSYDNFDPNEVAYVRALFNAMGYDPDQNEIAVQEILQNQFGTGDQVSKDTLLMTFGRTDDGPGLLTAMGTVGTYGEFLDAMNQQTPVDQGNLDQGTGDQGTGDQLPGEELADQNQTQTGTGNYPGLITEGIVDGQFGYYRYDPETMTDSSQAEFVPLSFEEYMGIFAPGQENFGKMYGSSGSYEQLPMEFYQSEQFSNFIKQHAEEELRRQTDPNYMPPMSDTGMYDTSDGKYSFSGSNNQLAGAYEAWLATQGGETTPVDPAPVEPPPYEPPPQDQGPPLSEDPIFDPQPVEPPPETPPVEYLSGAQPGFDVQTYIDQATAPIDRSAYTQGVAYGPNLMPGDPDQPGGYRVPVYTPTPTRNYGGLNFAAARPTNSFTAAGQNIQAAQLAGAAIGGSGSYGGIPLNFDPNNWVGTASSLPAGVGTGDANQQMTCPEGYVLAMENGAYYCKNTRASGGGMSQAMDLGPDRVEPTYTFVKNPGNIDAQGFNKGGEAMGIGSFFPEELVEQMGPGLVSSRERTYTYPDGIRVQETQSTGRFMFGDR